MRGLRRRVGRHAALAFLLAALVVSFILGSTGIALADKWTDISDASWYAQYGITVDQAASVASGYADGSFHPKEAVKRGQFAKMVVDGFGVSYATPAVPTFSDVPKSNTFFKYVEGGVLAGIISGYADHTYKPNNTISRQQANNILGSYLSSRELAQNGSIAGSKGSYASLNAWYAAEGVAILAGFHDATNIAAVHAPATAYLVYHDVVKGSNGYLTPGTTLTRAQAVALVVRVKNASLSGAYTSEMALSLISPAPNENNTISISGTGGTRLVTVNVVNGTTSVALQGIKTAAQGGTVGGTNASNVAVSGTDTARLFTVDTSAVASGGVRSFTLTVSETGKSSIVYTVTVNVASGLNLVLISPSAGTNNTLKISGSLNQWTADVNVASGTNSVILGGTKSTTQTVSLSGANSGLVTIGGSTTSPTFTVNTSSIATSGGSLTFLITLSESGKQSVVYTVTVTVGPEFVLTLTSPSHATSDDNNITVTGSGTAWNVLVGVQNGTQGVVLTGAKTSSQTVTIGGTNAASVTAGGTSTAPTYTIDTAGISGGGSRVFTLTLSESGQTDIVFAVTVNVLSLTSDLTLSLAAPAPSTVNTIASTGSGVVRTVTVQVANTTSTVVLAGVKTSSQTVTIGGTNAGNVSTAGTTTVPTFTVDTASLASAGGSRSFTITLKESGKSSITYNVTVQVLGITDAMALALTSPTPSLNNTITVTGTGTTRTVAVTAINNTSTVTLTGTKTAAQSVAVGGTNAASVAAYGTSTSPIYGIDTSDIAVAGGSKVFTLTLTEPGHGTIVYSVTVTILGPYTADISLALTTPSPGVGNSLTVTGTGETRTVDVSIVNGINSVVITGVKTSSQIVTISGTNASNVVAGGTSQVPTYTVNTSSIASGGTKVFSLTVQETGKSSIVYNVTVTIGGLTDPPMTLVLDTPTPSVSPSTDNTISVTGTGSARTVTVNVQSGTASVILIGTKLVAQTVVVGGLNAGDVTQGSGGTTAPSFTIDTSGIAAIGGTRVFSLTLTEPGKGSIVYNVTVTVALPFTAAINLVLHTPTPDSANKIDPAIDESGGLRPVNVYVQNGTTSVVLWATKTAAQTVTKSGSDSSSVTISGSTTAPIYTVNTTSISTGGSKTFNLTVVESGHANVVYQVTVNVGGLTDAMTLVLHSPSPDPANALYITGSGATRTVTINVQNGTSSVVVYGTKTTTQFLQNASSGVTGSNWNTTFTDPTINLNTSSKASSGGSLSFTIDLSESGEGSIHYTFNVNVDKAYTADILFAPGSLTSPTGAGDTIDITATSVSTRTVAVDVVNGITSVVLTGTKTVAQTVAKGGTDTAYVTIGGGSGISPTFTINTASISSGGTRSFTLTVSETGKNDIVYSVVVTVSGQTTPMTMTLHDPTPDDNNTYTETGSGGARTVTVNVENGTDPVVLRATKLTDQTVTVGGANAGDVTPPAAQGFGSTTVDFSVNTSSVAAGGGSKVFTITLSKAGESSIVYNVTVNVAMSPMVFVLTTPTPGALNTLTGGGADTDVVVHVVNGITSVVITGTKTAGQTVSKSGTDSAYVSIGGTATAPTFTVNTSSIAAAGGTRTFKLTLNEVGKGTIVYDVTVTVAGYTDQMTLSLTTPSPGGGNTINVTGTGGARAVAVSVINGTGTVELTGGKTVAQDTSIGGTNAGDVTVGGSGTAPTFTIDTDSIKAAGGSKTFTITLSETGKGSIVYTVTVTVAAP